MAMAEIHPHGNDRRTSFPYQCVGCHNVKNAIFRGHFRSETAIRSDAKFYEISLPYLSNYKLSRRSKLHSFDFYLSMQTYDVIMHMCIENV